MIFIPSVGENFNTATSYLTVSDADDIIGCNEDFDCKNNSNKWSTLDTKIKKYLLVRSSLLIDGMNSYIGKKKDKNQILKFPREGFDGIPEGVRHAVCSLIIGIIKKNIFKGIKSETIGKMSWQYDISSGAKEEVMLYLDSFINKGGFFKIVSLFKECEK